jgi:tRNA splicing endonuclease
MSDNIVKSDDVVSKKTSSTNKKTNVKDEIDIVTENSKKSPVPKKKVANASPGKKFVYFSSGSAYVTKSGFRFTTENRIYELDSEEADYLLSLDNFRLPDQLELEDYYKENN